MPTTAFAMGWLRDQPDFRDYTINNDKITPQMQMLGQASVKSDLKKMGVLQASTAALPVNTDLREFFPDVYDQEHLGSCTAQAGVGLVEYFQNRAFGTHASASRLFLYKVTRELLGLKGDTGAYLRTTMAALTLFGCPPEQYWAYTDHKPEFDTEPNGFCYAYAQNYQAISYYRLDTPEISPDELLNTIKKWLVAGLPSMFGFSVYSSYTQAGETGEIPLPVHGERIVGGHAVIAVGYDDTKYIKNNAPGAKETVGAFLIRNSWGKDWGIDGYGWLPYDYVLQALAVDWWTLTKSEWVNSQQFGL
ncbi:C1 family peptidase [Janthinobacterium fluminis]|uniref:C1 family peptidase n=1 Tax=Janthinobacterium fluminis TaxID=2987524 RepID=A0ABT5JVS4_9BURK|nr:C1 family peptidase [Janthinobacterium fluminis]MDC8756689.1 C1 family peptidase [Janthinobacterium fluminis]